MDWILDNWFKKLIYIAGWFFFIAMAYATLKGIAA